MPPADAIALRRSSVRSRSAPPESLLRSAGRKAALFVCTAAPKRQITPASFKVSMSRWSIGLVTHRPHDAHYFRRARIARADQLAPFLAFSEHQQMGVKYPTR